MERHCVAWVRLTTLVAALAILGAPAWAADNLVGHQVSVSKYRGEPSLGALYKIVIKAGDDGNPAAFPLPLDPATNGGSVSVARGGGVLIDPLTAGTWSGLGQPPGSSGWKYKNPSAPQGGAVSLLLIRPRLIKVVAKATGSMPVPSAPNAVIDTVIVADAQRYCAEAALPQFKEIAGKLIKSKDQLPPAACPPCVVGVDSDGDRLDDCYETNSGVFASPTDAGTDPLDPDTDDDALGDGDEVVGTAAGLELPAMGTNPLHKDLLLEYDWFDENLECGQHSHRPTSAAVAMVTAAFAAAPVPNPDGATGIHFIHDYGQGGVFDGGNFIPVGSVLFQGVNNAEFDFYKAANFAANRHGYFRYVLMPHRYNNNSSSSGQAELPGNDMIVSLYCANTDENVAHTIVHELGHNLGLGHGGFQHCNYKPNYNSVMNYLYQFPGVDTDCDSSGDGNLDYSIGDRIDLDENNVDENLGTCGAPAIDWNGNSIIESGLVLDLNPEEIFQGLCGGTLSILSDYDDWANISFAGLADFDGAPRRPVEVIDCTNPAPLPGAAPGARQGGAATH